MLSAPKPEAWAPHDACTSSVRFHGTEKRRAMALLWLHSLRWVHIVTYKGRRSPREKKKRKLKFQLSRTPARKDQQGFGMLLIAAEKRFRRWIWSHTTALLHCIDFFGCCFSIFPFASACASGFSFFHISSIWVSVVHNIAIAPVRKTFSNALRFWILHNLNFFHFVVFRPWDWLSSPTAILQSFLTQYRWNQKSISNLFSLTTPVVSGMVNVTHSRAFWIRCRFALKWFLLTLRVDSKRFLYSSNSASPCCLRSVSDKPHFDVPL